MSYRSLLRLDREGGRARVGGELFTPDSPPPGKREVVGGEPRAGNGGQQAAGSGQGGNGESENRRIGETEKLNFEFAGRRSPTDLVPFRTWTKGRKVCHVYVAPDGAQYEMIPIPKRPKRRIPA